MKPTLFNRLTAGLLAAVLCLSVLAGCAAKPQKELTRYSTIFYDVFDTVTQVIAYCESEEEFTKQMEALHADLISYNQLYDIYNDYDGVVNVKTINDNAGKAPVQVDDRILSMLELARQMVAIGTAHGRKVAALITDMDKPLGHNIGNALEVAESMAVLQGKGPADLTEVCLQLAGNMLVLAGKGDMSTCRKLAESVIADGSAFEKCCQMFAAQGGDISVLRDADKFQKAKYSYELTAPADGYIYKNDVEKIGNASVLLGAGRIKKEDSIDFAAGITMHKKLGDYVKAGESICTFYADDESLFAAAEEMYRGGLVIRDEPPTLPPLVYARVTSDGVERF